MLTLPSGRRVVVMDVIVAIWSIGWILMGVWVGETLYGLTELSGTFRTVGGAVNEVGRTLGNVNVPLLGAPLDRASGAIQRAGRDVVKSGVSAREEIELASVLLGLAVALVPVLLLLLLYVPARVARAGEAAAVRRFLGEGGAEAEALLARRALNHVPYRRLQKVLRAPWDSEEPATRRALAQEELRRLGVSSRRLAASGETGQGSRGGGSRS